MRSLVFDVESVGLHGEGFAVGWVVIEDGEVAEENWCACSPDKAMGSPEGRKWVTQHVPQTTLKPDRHHSKASPRQVRDAFWAVWERERDKGSTIWADCAWPVESRFLIACIEDARLKHKTMIVSANLPGTKRCWDGPYPLHEISTIRRAAGLSGGEISSHLSRQDDELPAHHPLTDAKQSARLLLEAQRVLRERTDHA
jgi:hypothetical protein